MDNREDVGEYYPGGSVVPAKPEPAAHPVESVNGKAGAVVLTAADVGALPDTTEIPDAEKVSSWGFLRKAWSDLVAAFADKVHRHTIGQVDRLQSELSTLDQKATEASDLAASAQGTADSAAQQVSGAYAAANAAELKAGNAFTTAMVADSKASTAKLTAENALSTAESKASASELSDLSDYVDLVEERRDQNERSITRAFAEIATKLDSDERAADSAKLGGVEADKYALKTALANKVTNYGQSHEIRFLDAPDGGNVVFDFRSGGIDRVSFSSLGDGESIEFSWIEGDEGMVLHAKDITTKSELEGKLDATAQAADSDKLGGKTYAQVVAAAASSAAGSIPYTITTSSGSLTDRAVNVITASGSALTITPPAAVSGKVRDFVVRINCTAETTINWAAFGQCEVRQGDSWADMMAVEAGKGYIYRFTDLGGSALFAAREEVA